MKLVPLYLLNFPRLHPTAIKFELKKTASSYVWGCLIRSACFNLGLSEKMK